LNDSAEIKQIYKEDIPHVIELLRSEGMNYGSVNLHQDFFHKVLVGDEIVGCVAVIPRRGFSEIKSLVVQKEHRSFSIFANISDFVTYKSLQQKGDPIIGVELKALIKNNEVAICPRTVQASHDQVTFHNGTNLKVSNVIWATGFTSDYSWISMPGVINEYGKPVHSRGVSKEKGLFFLGLPWQYNRGSALIGGVAADAEYITTCILENVE
jgi:hypothetical protein